MTNKINREIRVWNRDQERRLRLQNILNMLKLDVDVLY